MTETFTTYWLIDGEKITSFETMRRKVLAGQTAVEVSAERQQVAAMERERRATLQALHDEELNKIAVQREHDNSPEGKAEAARRSALENPGGIVSSGMSPLAELDAFLPDKTSLLR